MTTKEKEILRETKRFAKVNNIHFDKMTENMILNAMREVEKVQAQQLKDFLDSMDSIPNNVKAKIVRCLLSDICDNDGGLNKISGADHPTQKSSRTMPCNIGFSSR